MRLGIKHTEETKRKMSESRKGENHYNYGRPLSKEHKKAISIANTGKQFSEEHRRKISEASRNRSIETRKKLSEARKGKVLSLETRKKISEAHRGKHLSEEVKMKISKAKTGVKRKPFSDEWKERIGNAKRGEKNHNYGKHLSEEYRKKISANHADMSGRNNPAYKDGRCGTKEYEICRAAQKRARKLDRTPDLTKAEEDRIKFIYEVASTMANMHVDHIRPLTRGGLHHPDNLQILDGGLNDSKKNRYPLSDEENRRFQGLRL